MRGQVTVLIEAEEGDCTCHLTVDLDLPATPDVFSRVT